MEGGKRETILDNIEINILTERREEGLAGSPDFSRRLLVEDLSDDRSFPCFDP